MSSTLEASVFMGKNYLENSHFIKNTRKDLTMKQMFDISEKLIVGQSDEFLEWIQLTGKILHGSIYLWSVMKKSSVSRMQRFMYFRILCYALERCNRNQSQILCANSIWIWFKDSSKYRTLDTIDGEPMEFEWNIFPGFTILQLCNKVQEFMSEMSDQPEEFKGRIIFMSMFNNISWWSEDNEQECESDADPVSIYARRFPPGRWSSRVHCPEERLKTKEVENYQYTSALMGERLKLFFGQLFLLMSSVSTEQSQICVRNTEPAMQERWDPCWQDNLTHCSSQQVCWWKHLHLRPKLPHKKIYRKSTKNEWKGSHNKTVWSKFVLMQDSWQQVKSDSTSWQRTLTSSYNLQSKWHGVSTLYHEMKNQLTLKVGFEGTPKLGPCWKSQPVTCKLNTEWKLELNLWTKTILTRGSEFLMDWTSWSQTWSTESTTTTSRKPLKRRRKRLRWRRNYLLLQADQRLKQNREDVLLLAHPQELYLSVKEYGLILNQELNQIKRTQWQKAWTLFFGTENYLEKKMVRSNSGDWKMIFGTNLRTMWKSKMAGGGGNKKIFQHCTDPSGQEILCLRATIFQKIITVTGLLFWN